MGTDQAPYAVFGVDPASPDHLLAFDVTLGMRASANGGASWFALKGGLPTAQMRDLAIQPRENDLVVATFGRGFYVLDDMTPLRFAGKRRLDSDATLFPVRPALAYVPFQQLGYRGKGFQGENLYAAENPPFGAVFTLHLKSELQTLKKALHDSRRRAPTNAARFRSWTVRLTCSRTNTRHNPSVAT